MTLRQIEEIINLKVYMFVEDRIKNNNDTLSVLSEHIIETLPDKAESKSQDILSQLKTEKYVDTSQYFIPHGQVLQVDPLSKESITEP